MLATLDEAGKLLGAIAYRKYDGRFPQLQFEENKKIVEMIRLYVLPDARRSGLARNFSIYSKASLRNTVARVMVQSKWTPR